MVAISSPSREEMGRLHTQHKINIIEHTAAIQGDRFSVDAFVTASQMETLREEDFEVEVIRDMDEVVEELKDAVSDEEQDVG